MFRSSYSASQTQWCRRFVASPLLLAARYVTGDMSAARTAPAGVAADDQATPHATTHAHDISILNGQGNPVTIEPLRRFSDLVGLSPWLSEGLERMRFPSTTDIQSFTIPALEQKHDLIGLAPTGSGKTVAFAVPALKRMKPTQDGSPSVLVLAPTRELVQQTAAVFNALGGRSIHVGEAYGGTSREAQSRYLSQGCDVLVACPGRLKDFLDNGDVSIRNVEFVVLDEADRLLDMGFQDQLEAIMGYLDRGKSVQTMMWSATWPDSVQELARRYLSPDRLVIRAGTAGTGLQINENIRQHLLFSTGLNERVETIVSMIEDGKIDEDTSKVIIFVERQADTERAANALSDRLGIDRRYVGSLHGGLSQRQRDFVMRQFKHSNIRLLVATDVASRGLDIPDITCVINFQAPKNIDSYCHRIGRTGRAGRAGESYTFLGPEDGGIAADLIEYLKRCEVEAPSQLTEMAHRHHAEKSNRSRGKRSSSGGFRGGRRDYSPRSSGFQSRNHSYNRDFDSRAFDNQPRRAPLPKQTGW